MTSRCRCVFVALVLAGLSLGAARAADEILPLPPRRGASTRAQRTTGETVALRAQ